MCEVNTQVIHALSYLCYKDFHLTSISPLQILVSCLKSIIPTILKPPGWHWKGAFLLFQGTFSVLIQVRIYFHLAVTRLLRVSTKWKDNYTMFIILKNLQQIDCSLKKKKALSLNWWKSHCAVPYPSCCHPCGCVPASQPGNWMLTAHIHTLFFLLSNVLALYSGIQTHHNRGDGYEHGKGVGSEKEIAPFQGSRELWKCLMTSWGWSWISFLG